MFEKLIGTCINVGDFNHIYEYLMNDLLIKSKTILYRTLYSKYQFEQKAFYVEKGEISAKINS